MKRKYKRIVLSFIFILFSIMGLTAQGSNSNDVESLIRAFEDSQAEIDTYWLHVGIPYTSYTTDVQLLETGNKLSAAFMLPEQKSLQQVRKQGVYSSIGTWGNGSKVELLIKRYSEQSKQLYLIFRLKGNHSLEAFSEYYTELEETLQENHLSPKINSCIQGNINDKLNNKEQFVLLKDVLESLKANEVESLSSDLVKSISAYSPKIENSIMTGQNKMNIQVATHVDSLNKKTVLTMGTPIITIEY